MQTSFTVYNVIRTIYIESIVIHEIKMHELELQHAENTSFY